MRKGEVMIIVTVLVPEGLLAVIDELVRNEIYPNRSDVIRTAIRFFVKEEVKAQIAKVKSNCLERTLEELKETVRMLQNQKP